MTTQRKFFSRIPVWLPAIGLVAGLYNTVDFSVDAMRQPETFEGMALRSLIAAASQLFLVVFFAFALWRRMGSPALEITEDSIVHSGLWRMFFPKRRVALAEVAELLPGSRKALALRMRSDELKELSLFEVRKVERDEVRRAIEAALAAKAAG